MLISIRAVLGPLTTEARSTAHKHPLPVPHYNFVYAHIFSDLPPPVCPISFCPSLQYGLVHISVGDLLRDEVARGSAIGKKAKDFMDKGVLVPDEVVVEMVKGRLAGEDVAKKGWLLDGYPRSATQAQAIEKANIRPDLFLLIDVSQV